MRLATAILLVWSASATAQAPSDSSKEARDIVARHVAAAGGELAFRRHRSRHVTADVEIPTQGVKGSLESHAVAPDKLLVRTTLPGFGTTHTGYDGTVGWTVSDVTGAALLQGKQLDQLRESADLLTPLHRGVRALVARGVRDFQGMRAHAITVVTASGDEYEEYYDPTTSLHIGTQHRVSTPGGDVPTTTILADYRSFDMILLPTTITQLLPGGQVMVTRVRSVRHDTVDAALIAPPEAVRALMKEVKP